MRTILILMVLLLAGCIPATSPRTSYRVFNKHGRYEGRIDSSGRIFDEHGKYKRKIEKQ
jgi:hypothetical protein